MHLYQENVSNNVTLIVPLTSKFFLLIQYLETTVESGDQRTMNERCICVSKYEYFIAIGSDTVLVIFILIKLHLKGSYFLKRLKQVKCIPQHFCNMQNL